LTSIILKKLSELKFFNKITKVITIVLINIPDPNL